MTRATELMLSSPLLVIEDTELNLQLIMNILTKRGFTEIAVARDGLEALERIHSCAPDLIIMDVVMPRMDGFVLCKYLRSRDAYRHIPVLVLSATEAEYDKMAALGATALIQKPIIPRMLLSKVEENLLSYHASLQGGQAANLMENG